MAVSLGRLERLPQLEISLARVTISLPTPTELPTKSSLQQPHGFGAATSTEICCADFHWIVLG